MSEQPAGSEGYCAVCYHLCDRCSHCDPPAWQPIATVPKDGTPIVVTAQDNQLFFGCYVFHRGRWEDQYQEAFVGADGSRELAGFYTHWFAIPALPPV